MYVNETGELTQEFRDALPDLLGDDYYNDPEKQQPTKVFDDVKDVKGLVKMTLDSKRAASKGRTAFEAEMAEKLKGMVKIPKEGANADEIKAYRQAIGAGETKEAYMGVFTIPATAAEDDKEYYGKLAGVVSEVAHEEGISMSAAKQIWDKVNGQMIEYVSGMEQQGQKLMQDDIDTLRAEKGAGYDKWAEDIDRALDKIGSESLAKPEDQQKAYDEWLAKNLNASEEMKGLMKKELASTVGQKLKSILTMFGLLQVDEGGKLKGGHPAVMKAVAELVPLINPSGAHYGPDGGGSSDTEWFTDYSEVGQDKTLDME